MRYYKAIVIETKPFIQWASWANNSEELDLIEESTRKLILAENEIPANISGVCPLEIVDGELSQRSTAAMATFETEFLQDLLNTNLKIRREQLKELLFEIQFTTEILEDATALQALYDAKLREYNDLKI